MRRMTMFVVLLVTLVLLQTHYGEVAEGARKSQAVSKQQQRPIKTFHTRDDDIIDCIDIDKQPAFDNPLLKTHKIQMQPQMQPSFVLTHNLKNVNFDHLQECPQGTVPIPRTKTLRRKYDTEPNGILMPPMSPQKTSTIQVPPLIPLVRHYEVLETADVEQHYGVKGLINLNNPLTGADQLSSAQIWIQNGPPEDLNLIEAGWFVYPRFYGDSKTRLYTSWTGIGKKNKGCINYLCAGFVQVDNKLFLGTDLGNISAPGGGDMYVLNTQIARNKETGNWWLTLHDVQVGYWPKELFSYLSNQAVKAGFGAVTGAPANNPSPQMGNGNLPNVTDLTRCGFIARMKVIDIDGKENGIEVGQVRVAGDKPPCYEQHFRGYIDSNFEITTTFGGPGGSCG